MSSKRFIQVGCGGFGRAWVERFMPRLIDDEPMAKAVAAVDINPATFPTVQRHYQLPPDRCYTDIDRAFAENDADFVIVVVPPAHHEAVVDKALAHDMDILSEKPIADSMLASARIYRKVTDAGKKMAVTMSHRFDRDKQTLQRLIESGAYGPLDYLIGRNTWNCRRRGQWGAFRYEIPDPLLIEGTVHHFDIMRALSGANAKTVHALSWNPVWSDFAGDAQALLLMEMENGVKVCYEGAKANATSLNNWTQDYWRAECDKATLELDKRKLRIMSDLDGPRQITEPGLDERPSWMNCWLAEQFIGWLDGGDAPPNSLDDNIQCTALLFAAIESAHSGAIVDVQAYLAKHVEGMAPRSGGCPVGPG